MTDAEFMLSWIARERDKHSRFLEAIVMDRSVVDPAILDALEALAFVPSNYSTSPCCLTWLEYQRHRQDCAKGIAEEALRKFRAAMEGKG